MPRYTDDEPATDFQDSRTGSRFDLREAADLLSRRLSGAIVLAGGLIAFGLYSGGSGQEPATYQAFAAGGEVFRLNTDSGTIIACNATRCTRILQRGQDLAEGQGNTLFKTPLAPALPAPQTPPPAVQQVAPAPPAPTQPVPAPPPQGE